MSLDNYFLDMSLKTQGRKNINKQVRLHQAKKLMHRQEKQKVNLSSGKNICKPCT